MAGSPRFARHCHSESRLAVEPAVLFARLDDHRRLASHMEKPSWMAAGATMHIACDEREGRAVGSVIRMTGCVMGVRLTLEEVVTEHEPPRRKAWETVGQPRLLVIGPYRMGMQIDPVAGGSRLLVFIDYDLPANGVGRLLAALLGPSYAAWCTRRMANDALTAFGPVLPCSSRDGP
jgi:hypothetical protein